MINLTLDQVVEGFKICSHEYIPEIEGDAYTLLHLKSGARLLYLKNEDVNKTFSITFKTPPQDDTGVFHILEHSVLCGSEKFPVKEPFVNLLKSSMQTFLNAMTFPDKTMYPVASTNEQDLLNLMDVYLDAVLHPMIYKKRTIFEQEGWHYELASNTEEESDNTDETASCPELTINGVVYNEMKGALSDPNSVLYLSLQSALFPDTTYNFESGGTPRAIPDLTYEQFLESHAQHYRLDNSYLTLYGNLDIEKMLKFLSNAYLNPVAEEEEKRAQKRTDEGKSALTPHLITKQQPLRNLNIQKTMATAPENACMALGYVIGDASDRTRMVAADILIDAIAGSNEAPLKRALLNADFCDDASSFLADSLLQPFAVIQLRGIRKNAAKHFLPLVKDTLHSLAHGQLDHDLIEASLSRAEFVMREQDFGMADGVALSMAALSGWLYDDSLATTYLKYEEDFAYLRQVLNEGYFEELIKSIFLSSNHMAQVEIIPIDANDDPFEAERLTSCAARMTKHDFTQVKQKQAALRQHQEQPDLPEALLTLPRLSISDIGPAPKEPPYEACPLNPIPSIRHHATTRGITYTYRYFDLSHFDFDDLPYLQVLSLMLGKLATAHHSASELDTLTNGKLGSLTFFIEVYEDEYDFHKVTPRFTVGASALAENMAYLLDLPREIMLTTDFSDTSKIKDTLQQRRIGLEQSFASSGHANAMSRLASYYQSAGVVRQKIGGIDFYRFLKDLLANFDQQAGMLSSKLTSLAERLFVDNTMRVSFTGSDDTYTQFWNSGAMLNRTGNITPRLVIPQPTPLNEAFIVPSDVCYVAQGSDRRLFNSPYTGAWRVVSRALSYDYLWNEIRVKGGAYGAGFGTTRTGNARFYSYRDPNLDETIKRFTAASDWLSNFTPSQSDLEGYIVSTVSSLDAPSKTRTLIRYQDGEWLTGRDPSSRLQSRKEMMEVTAADFPRFAKPLKEILEANTVCVFGSKEIIESSQRRFAIVDLLGE